MGVFASAYAWLAYLHVGAAGSMATLGSMNMYWWFQDRSQRWLVSIGFFCYCVSLALVVSAVGLTFPSQDVFEVLVPLRVVLVGVTAALFLGTLGSIVPIPSLKTVNVALILLGLTYAAFGVTSKLAYTFKDGSPWQQIEILGYLLLGALILIFVIYAARALRSLTGSRRRELTVAMIGTVGLLAVPTVARPGELTEAIASLWTIPISVMLAWWCSVRVLRLDSSLVSAQAGWKSAQLIADYDARHDQLTGLPNSEGGAEILQTLLDTCPPEKVVGVAKVRVDGLESVHSADGSHAAGLVLRVIAGRLAALSPSNGHLARVGETSFLMMTRVSREMSITKVREDIGRQAASLWGPLDIPRDLLITVGISVAKPDSTAMQLLQEAGTAVIAAELTRGRVQLYRPELRSQVVERVRMTKLLATAVDRDEFELHYQPVLETNSLSRVGVEALVRWRHQGQLRPPAEWIPIVEQQGLMKEIGLHILRLAVRDHSVIGCPISVNVSAYQLADRDFVNDVLDAIGTLTPDAIILEITESAVIADLDQAREKLTAIRSAGIRVALDDFGTEYSSLSRLSKLPFDVLKIDRSFVTQVLSPSGRAIVTAIHALAQALGKSTVAEGIETDDQLRAVTEIGCDAVQGFLTGRPVPLAPLNEGLTESGQ